MLLFQRKLPFPSTCRSTWPHWCPYRVQCKQSTLMVRDQWASYQIPKIAGCACAGNAGNVFPRRRFQKKLLVSDPGMHHGTCVTHVPWCMSGSLTCGDGENVPGIPGACHPAILRIWQEAHGTGTVWSVLPLLSHIYRIKPTCCQYNPAKSLLWMRLQQCQYLWRLESPTTRPFVQYFVHTNIKETIKVLHYRPFVMEIHQWMGISPHKGPVMWK